MNRIILKQIKEILSAPMKQAGFKTNGQRYKRVVNRQIFQCVEFQGGMSGSEFTVNVYVGGLYNAESVNEWLPAHSARLGQLLDGRDKWWPYTEEAAKEVSAVILDYLLPLLDEYSTYEDKHRIVVQYVKDDPDPDRQENDVPRIRSGLSCYGSYDYSLCILQGDYDNALICLRNCRKDMDSSSQTNIDWLTRCIAETTSRKYKKEWTLSVERMKRERQEEFDRLNLLEEKIRNRDCSELLAQMKETEAKNLENLKKLLCEGKK